MNYFIYSKEQHKLMTENYKKTGRRYLPGQITVAGTSRNWTELSTENSSRFSDYEVVTSTESLDGVKFTQPRVDD